MSLFGRGKKQQSKEEKAGVKQEEKPHEPGSRLSQLVPNNPKLSSALSNFLLSDPERQVTQLADSMAKGDQARARGEKYSARVHYETAAKVELFKGNKDGVRKCLQLAEEVSGKDNPNLEFHESLLANLDEVMHVSELYFTNKKQ